MVAGTASSRQRRSERTRGALKCLRAQSREERVSEGEGKEREREWREKTKVNHLT